MDHMNIGSILAQNRRDNAVPKEKVVQRRKEYLMKSLLTSYSERSKEYIEANILPKAYKEVFGEDLPTE